MLLYRRLRYGYAFRRIRFSGPKYAIVDPEDYEPLARCKWYYINSNGKFYAARVGRTDDSPKRTILYMHRQIVEVPEGMVLDHINREPLDNRKANLRPATRAQNLWNSTKRKGGSSKYRGVSYKKQIAKWIARMYIDGKETHLGCFEEEIDAAKAYDKAAKKHRKPFAVLNFPDPKRKRRKN